MESEKPGPVGHDVFLLSNAGIQVSGELKGPGGTRRTCAKMIASRTPSERRSWGGNAGQLITHRMRHSFLDE